MRYRVLIETADRGRFAVLVSERSPQAAEAVACQAISYSISHSITASHAVPFPAGPVLPGEVLP